MAARPRSTPSAGSSPKGSAKRRPRPLGERPMSGASIEDTRRSGSEFRPDLEGLRAVAVALVLLYHANVPKLHGGFVGVDVFFVLSGFLITGLILRELRATGRIDLPQFYARRARRPLPAAARASRRNLI